MKQPESMMPVQATESREDFNWGATISVMVMILAFIGATFYVLVSSLNDLS